MAHAKVIEGTLLGDMVAAVAQKPPWWKRVLVATTRSVALAIVIILVASLVSFLTGQSDLGSRVDRVTKAELCILIAGTDRTPAEMAYCLRATDIDLTTVPIPPDDQERFEHYFEREENDEG